VKLMQQGSGNLSFNASVLISAACSPWPDLR
jgi:hypothetical protein